MRSRAGRMLTLRTTVWTYSERWTSTSGRRYHNTADFMTSCRLGICQARDRCEFSGFLAWKAFYKSGKASNTQRTYPIHAPTGTRSTSRRRVSKNPLLSRHHPACGPFLRPFAGAAIHHPPLPNVAAVVDTALLRSYLCAQFPHFYSERRSIL